MTKTSIDKHDQEFWDGCVIAALNANIIEEGPFQYLGDQVLSLADYLLAERYKRQIEWAAERAGLRSLEIRSREGKEL